MQETDVGTAVDRERAGGVATGAGPESFVVDDVDASEEVTAGVFEKLGFDRVAGRPELVTAVKVAGGTDDLAVMNNVVDAQAHCTSGFGVTSPRRFAGPGESAEQEQGCHPGDGIGEVHTRGRRFRPSTVAVRRVRGDRFADEHRDVLRKDHLDARGGDLL